MKKLFTILTAVGLFAFGTAANAAVVFLDESNSWTADGSKAYATVTIVESGDNIQFTVDPNAGAFDSVGGNFGLQAFSFDYDMREILYGTNEFNQPVITGYGDTLTGDIGITVLSPDGWIVSNDQNSRGGYGSFDFSLDGTGKNRADPLVFLITGVNADTVDNYTFSMVGHIADFSTSECANGCESAWFYGTDGTDRGLTPPSVPIPPAVWLFGSGLIGLVGVARRKDPVNV